MQCRGSCPQAGAELKRHVPYMGWLVLLSIYPPWGALLAVADPTVAVATAAAELTLWCLGWQKAVPSMGHLFWSAWMYRQHLPVLQGVLVDYRGAQGALL